jgi:hypothetical protein
MQLQETGLFNADDNSHLQKLNKVHDNIIDENNIINND